MGVVALRGWTFGCVLIALLALSVNLFGEEFLERPGSSVAVGLDGQVAVASVVGVVEVRRQGGEWSVLEPGEELSEGDEVRTLDFSQVILRPRHGATLTVTPNTTFTIGDETADVSRFTLGMGRVAADIERRRQRTYEFDSSAGSARADTQGGEFHLVADGEGLLGVVTYRGEVGLSSEGRRVVVPAGRQAVAMPGTEPGEPIAIPQDVFLQVNWPEGRTRDSSIVVAGQTDVGARIRVGGQTIPVDHEGRFQVDVPLSEGENRLVLLAEDGAGNLRTAESPVLIREVHRRPSLQLRVEGSVWE